MLTTREAAQVSVLDFGGADVSVPLSFGDPVLVDGAELEHVQSASLVGPRKRSVWLRFNGRIDQVNVSFFPGVAGAFVGLSMPEVVGRVVSPDDVWPTDFREGVEALAPLSTEQRLSRLTDLLLARLEPGREPGSQIRQAVRLIRENRGRVRVRWLADQVNLSVSQLERCFIRHVGVGPKLLARQTRLSELAADAMRVSSPNWAALAYNHGYADQAHMARDYRELMGLTPSGYAGIGADADFLQDALACPGRD